MATLLKTYENEGVTIYRADKLDVNGNPRHIVHFMDFCTDEEIKNNDVLTLVEMVAKKIKKSGYSWRKYTCKEFGGGFITQGDYCSGRENAKQVQKIRAIEIKY